MGKFIFSFISICFEMFIVGLLFYIVGTTIGDSGTTQQKFHNTLILFFGSAFDMTLFLYTVANIFKNAFLIKEPVRSTNAYIEEGKTTYK